MKKLILLPFLLLCSLAFGQSYPSPTYNNLTVVGSFTATGKVGLTSLAAQAANTVVANITSSSASPTAIAMPSCSAAGNALNYTSGTGWTCTTGLALTSGTLAQFSATTSAQLAGVISDETGSGALVFGTSPTLTTGSAAASPSRTDSTNLLATTFFVQDRLGNPPCIGCGTAAAGAFTTLSASSTISGAGFSNYLASPPPVGATAPNTGSFTNLTATGTLTGFTGRLLNVQVFTSSGTYTPTTGTNSVIVEILGAGGGGGGAVASNGTNIGVSGCGGGGGYIIHRMTSGFSGATVTIGAAGTSGANTGGAGGTGGSTSFGAITAGGGTGGQGTTAATTGPTNMAPVAGGTATGGNIVNVPGQPGFGGNYGVSANYAVWQSGGNSVYGTGATHLLNQAGANATGFGAGGGGVIQTTGGTTARAGGTGSPGLVIVWEYS